MSAASRDQTQVGPSEVRVPSKKAPQPRGPVKSPGKSRPGKRGGY